MAFFEFALGGGFWCFLGVAALLVVLLDGGAGLIRAFANVVFAFRR